MNDVKLLNKAADNIRILSASMVEKAKSGHPGGAMGAADFINVLFSEFMIYDPENPHWESRDRYFQDPGHMSPMLYSVLALAGKYTMEDLKNFRQWGSVTPGHPELDDATRRLHQASLPLLCNASQHFGRFLWPYRPKETYPLRQTPPQPIVSKHSTTEKRL